VAHASRCSRIAVVLGAHVDEVVPVLADLDVDLVTNATWADGVASSIRAAVTWAEARASDGLLMMVCDQPHLATTHLDALIVGSRVIGQLSARTTQERPVFRRYSRAARIRACRGSAANRGARALLVNAEGNRGMAARSTSIATPTSMRSRDRTPTHTDSFDPGTTLDLGWSELPVQDGQGFCFLSAIQGKGSAAIIRDEAGHEDRILQVAYGV